MNNYILIAIIIFYLVLMFCVAYWAEKKAKQSWINNGYVYTLSLAVYCSAWTYYGSVGIAATSGVNFLTTYLGPVIAFPIWIIVFKKVIRISKQNKVSSIADFLSLRYGNDRFIGALVTLICVLGILPYISLQLKAVSETFAIVTDQKSLGVESVFEDTTFYVALLLAIFAAFFGAKSTDASNSRRGIVFTVALESVLKLVFFLIIGVYITFFLFEGTSDIFEKINMVQDTKKLITIDGLEDGINWYFMILLSFLAIFLLPRQFHMTVIENTSEKHLAKSIWLFPLYLLLFNVFVIFIAWGGVLKLGTDVNQDYYTILLPLQEGNIFLTTMVFIGGFSAVISMVIVSTLALSIMLSNNLIIPYGFLDILSHGNTERNIRYIINIRKLSVFSLIMGAYFFYINFQIELTLFSIGQISFVVLSQLAPAFFIGLFWNRGSALATKVGMLTGTFVTIYTLILPFILEAIVGDTYFIDQGPFGIELLKPYNLFGIGFMTPVTHSFFWSMVFNILTYVLVSLHIKSNYRERNFAEVFVNKSYQSLDDSGYVWKGEAYVADIKKLLFKFLGVFKTEKALESFYDKHNLPKDMEEADARLISFSERLLRGRIGSASSKILISSVVQEQPVSLSEVLEILNESKETMTDNDLLKRKSEELTVLIEDLQRTNNELLRQDKLKDEFLDTIAQELKTPITSIWMASEALMENKEMEPKLKDEFLKNILTDYEKLSKLINNLLNLEKMALGKEGLNKEVYNIVETVQKSVSGIDSIASKENIQIVITSEEKSIKAIYDEEKILQVFTNILYNSMRFAEPGHGIINVAYHQKADIISVIIQDNGGSKLDHNIRFIFEDENTNKKMKKPTGSELGLMICKQIIEEHEGKIWIDPNVTTGIKFVVEIPEG